MKPCNMSMEPPLAHARAGLVVWPRTEAVRVNIPAMWTWERRIITAGQPTTTKHKRKKYHMPNVKSSNRPNSVTANSRSEMRAKIINYVRAGYPALYIVSPEEQRVELELKSVAAEM